MISIPMSLSAFPGRFPKLHLGLIWECAARAVQTARLEVHVLDTGLRTCTNTALRSALSFSTILPILESKNKENETDGFGTALPLLVIIKNYGSTTSWSALLSFIRNLRRIIHAFSAELGGV